MFPVQAMAQKRPVEAICRGREKEFVSSRLVVGLLLMVLSQAGAALLVGNVVLDKALYAPGGTVFVHVDLTNGTGDSFTGSVETTVWHLGYEIAQLPIQTVLNLVAGATETKTFAWAPPAVDYQGYLLLVRVKNSSGQLIDSGSSAIDVSSDWVRFPRYGYVAQYDAGIDADAVMRQLKDFHLNTIQFYDWQWKHHIPYSPDATWPDIANRTIYRSTLLNLISAAHSYGMLAFNYNLYGGAFDNYWSDGSGAQVSMGIFSTPQPSGGYTPGDQLSVPMPNGWQTAHLYEMNNRDAAWQSYIFAKEQEVFEHFAFDGWHIDSLGQHNAYDFGGASFSLDDYNDHFINNAKAALGRRMVFNSVDAVGEDQIVTSANVDVIYSELWDSNEHYADFKRRVDSVQGLGSKAVVFPAYLNRGLVSGFFNEASVRLADAAIFACGASHLELGDGNKMLHTEYFPDDENVLMTPSLAAAIRIYYDFLVAYQNLLRDATASANNQVSVSGVQTSSDGSAGTVWIISKETRGHNIIHLINLLNNTSTLWRDSDATYSIPPTIHNFEVKMYYSGPGSGRLWYATPDENLGCATELVSEPGTDAGGNYILFTLPQLRYWDMVWLEPSGITYVDQSYLGAIPNGTPSAPFRTVQDGYNATPDFNILRIAGGNYKEAPLTLSKRIRIEAREGPAIISR
jgi:dextranase